MTHAFQITATKPRAPTWEGKGKGTLTLLKQWKDKGELMERSDDDDADDDIDDDDDDDDDDDCITELP